MEAHEVEKEEVEPTSLNAKRIFWTSQSIKTNKSVFVSLVVEKVHSTIRMMWLMRSRWHIERI